ncbi:uncharacterized protein LOC143627459 [Bidens hawaiensis]|uniref:uncharacterized protein LOC143627459 n=1 Tax=Bidens hawaiensis TaxID=980011 RepID=UPI00404A95DB
MVSGILSAGVRKTIQSIKEIVGNHSDADIYTTLKDSNMDPNETAQKLLFQDPFHEVKRKRDRKEKSRHLHSAEASETLKVDVNPSVDSKSQQVKGVSLGSRRTQVLNVAPPVQVATKPHDSVTSPNSSVIGVYSSSDPVKIPSLASTPPAKAGAIKRAVGPAGVCRHARSENSAKLASTQATSVSNTKNQQSQSNVSESVPGVSSGRSFNNQHNSRPRQQLVTRQKVIRANKEWKPKPSQKPSVTEVGVIGAPKKSTPPAKKSKDLAKEASQLQNKVQIHEDQNVIIAAHIRVSEVDRCRLTFGSLGIESDVSHSSGFEETSCVEESHVEPLARLDASLSVSPPESSVDESSGSKQVESVDNPVHGSGSVSPDSVTESESQPTDRFESSSPPNMDNYTNIGLDRHSSPSYAPSETHQQQGLSEVPSCSQAYDPQAGYNTYFRPATDESLRSQVLQIPQEGFSAHAGSVLATTIPMVQQEASVAQIYPQVHLPHYANLMPYRQFISPVYVPPMAMPGYSNNPTYSPHLSTGSNYLLMPGANSAHVTANGLKYTIPQYKSVQAATPTGFGNFTTPTGYALNTPGVVGSGSGLEDSARIKYKDGNVYVPNPQGETSEHWMNPRDISSMQSASYYNMAGQSPHATYLPSHASFNAAAAAQSSHMQFPGLYHHPPQPAALANAHHTGPAIGGNAGVGVAAGAQVGGYQQQPQLNQMSWSGNF